MSYVATAAKIGFNSTLAYGAVVTPTYVTIGEIVSFTPAKMTAAKVDTSRFDSDTINSLPIEDNIPGWVNPGDWTIKLHYVEAISATLRGLFGVQKSWKYLRPDGTHGFTFLGYISELGDEVPLKDCMEIEIKVTINGGSVQAII